MLQENTAQEKKLVLASASPRRLDLLRQAGITPARLISTDIDETPKKFEHPRSLARRLVNEKALAALTHLRADPAWRFAYVLTADTVVAVGRRILDKTEYTDEAVAALNLLSGRAHSVFSGICLVTPGGQFRVRIVQTKIRFKRLSPHEIDAYIASGEWRGKAGAYAIQGIAGSFVQKIVGSYTNVVGLPLYEVTALLAGEGFDVTARWPEAEP